MYHDWSNQSPINGQNKIEFKVRSTVRVKVRYFILIKATLPQEDITGNHKTALKYIKQNPAEQQREKLAGLRTFLCPSRLSSCKARIVSCFTTVPPVPSTGRAYRISINACQDM
jgi:hypothetical protein